MNNSVLNTNDSGLNAGNSRLRALLMVAVSSFVVIVLSGSRFPFEQEKDLPYKPNDEFEIKLDFKFKERARVDPNRVDLDHPRSGQSRTGGPLPYLFLDFTILKQQPDETRVRVVENNAKVLYNKKIDMKALLKLELGFTDDIKDRVGPYEFTIIMLNEKKEPLRRVVVYFEQDGTYRVNGQVLGKI